MQKNASQKCKKDAGAKTQCKKMQITGLICFLFAFFCIVVFPFFLLLSCLFFVFFLHLPRLLQLFPEIMFVQLVPGLICFFSLSFCFLPRFFNFFPKSCLSSWPLVWFVVFFCTFLHVYFLPLSELLFSIAFFFFFEFVLFASPASALLICMFFALFLFFPSWKFTRISAIRQHNVYGVSFTKEKRHEPPSSRQDTTKGGWELITFSTYKEPPDVDPISYIHIFLGPQPHNAHDPKIVSGCTGCK